VSWDQQFYDPIILPGRKPLATLRDAANYITKLPKAEHQADEWQTAMQALLLVAEYGGPTMFARIGVISVLALVPAQMLPNNRRLAYQIPKEIRRESTGLPAWCWDDRAGCGGQPLYYTNKRCRRVPIQEAHTFQQQCRKHSIRRPRQMAKLAY
jgi:hypothetical protein